MTDLVDVAQENEERRTAEALSRFQQKRATEKAAENCVMCGDPISQERREALPSACHCIECAEFLERSKRQHGRR